MWNCTIGFEEDGVVYLGVADYGHRGCVLLTIALPTTGLRTITLYVMVCSIDKAIKHHQMFYTKD